MNTFIVFVKQNSEGKLLLLKEAERAKPEKH